MRAFVFTDPALTSRAGQFVWLELNVDDERNAAHRERLAVDALPTFFVLNPIDESVLMQRVDGMTVAEIASFLDEARAATTGIAPSSPAEAALLRADRLNGAAKKAEAAAAYREALAAAPVAWPEAVQRVKELVVKLQAEGMNIQYMDIGGGLGITYNQEEPPHPRDYAEALMKELNEVHCTLILEPGRVIVGNAGILVTKALYTKAGEEKNFIVVDAAMNDLIRPSLYGSYQRVQPVRRSDRPEWTADVVPICESSDFLAKDRKLPKTEQGELLAVMSAGAYGFSMSSNYNSRPRVAEVLVVKDKFFVIRQREDYDDLIRGETIPDFLRE